MLGSFFMSREPINRTTNASIRRAIGDRLSQHLGPEAPMPDRLQKLIEEMRRQEQSNSRG